MFTIGALMFAGKLGEAACPETDEGWKCMRNAGCVLTQGVCTEMAMIDGCPDISGLDYKELSWATMNNVCFNADCEFDSGPDCERVDGEWVNCLPVCYKEGSLPSNGGSGETHAFSKYTVSFGACKYEDGSVAYGESLHDVDTILDCAARCDSDDECSGFDFNDSTNACDNFRVKLWAGSAGTPGSSSYTCYKHSERVGVDEGSLGNILNSSSGKAAVGLWIALVILGLCLTICIPCAIAVFCCGACGYAATKTGKSTAVDHV